MSEEEKKAIEDVKIILKEWQKIVDIKDPIERDIEMTMYSEEMPFYSMKILLNLIEKQQKEIREIRSWKYTIDTIEDLEKLKELDLIKIKGKEYIAKNKIKEKIKELENCIDKPIVKLKVLQHGFTHEANSQFIIKTIINILSEILGD